MSRYAPRLCQANAEPDVAQTGARLRPLVAGLAEGVLALVADPLARAVRTPCWNALPFAYLAMSCCAWIVDPGMHDEADLPGPDRTHLFLQERLCRILVFAAGRYGERMLSSKR